MGDVRLGALPKSRKWRQVVEELRVDAGVDTIAASAADAAETSLRAASNDPAFLHAFGLLTLSYRIVAKHLDLSKNTVLEIMKRHRRSGHGLTTSAIENEICRSSAINGHDALIGASADHPFRCLSRQVTIPRCLLVS